MGKGGGGGHTTSTGTTYTSSLPEYAEPYYRRLADRAEAESKRGYTPYEDERIADFSGDTRQSFQTIRDTASAGTPGVDAAQQTAADVANYQSQNWTEADQQAYMDPYVQNVLRQQEQMAQRRFGEQAASREAAAVQAGAFGGNRRFVQDSLAQRDVNEQLNQMQAEGLSKAYQQAQQTFSSDQARALEAAGVRLKGSEQQAGLDSARQQLQLQQADALQRIGAQQEAKTQQGLDVAYQDFINQRDYPRQQLAFFSQILQGMPVTPQQEVTTYSPAANSMSQALGLGIGGYSLANLLGGQG